MSSTTTRPSVPGRVSNASGSRDVTPKKGERFRCQQCGMEIQVTADCKCTESDHVQFQCCAQPMTKV